MKLRASVRRSFASLHDNRSAARHKRPARQLLLESLEQRTVPSILFSTTGTRTVTDTGGPVLSKESVVLVFWGPDWQGATSYHDAIVSKVRDILSSPYFDKLSQYRSIGHGSLSSFTYIITADAPATNFTDLQARAEVGRLIDNGSFASDPTPQTLYVLIPQSGSTLSGNNLGDHAAGIDSKGLVYQYAVTTNYLNISMDLLTTILAHEMVEAATNPQLNITTDGVSQAAFHVPGNVTDEVADAEAQNYTYREPNGVLVQSYLSKQDSAYVVPDGNAQNFYVSSSRVLTINGDQLFANKNDHIALDDISGGVRAFLNGETVQFEPGAITAVVINTRTGNDLVQIQGNRVPITINLGSGNDTVEVGQLYNNLDRIRNNVTVHGGSGGDILNVYDTANMISQTYLVTGSTITRSLGFATITYESLIVQLFGGAGNDTYNVTGTNSYGLNLVGDSANTTVNVGNGGSLQDIHGGLTVSSPGYLTNLYVNNSSDPADHTNVQLSTDSADATFGQITGLAPATIYYRYSDVHAVDVHTGLGQEVVNVASTGVHGLNLFGHSANTNVHVGDGGSVQSIAGELTVSSPGVLTNLNIDDSNDPDGRTGYVSTYPVDAAFGQITGLAPGTIYFRYADIQSVMIFSGLGSNTINVQSTAASTLVTINAGTGNNAITIGNLANQLDDIQGPLTVNGQAATTTLTINDQGIGAVQMSSLTATTMNRTGAASINYANVASLTVNTSTGDGTAGFFNVLSTPAGTAVTINDLGSGSVQYLEFVVADNAGTLDGIQGPLAFHGRASAIDLLVLNDFHNSVPFTYILVANGISRSGLAPIRFDGQTELTFYASQQPGSAVNLQNVAAGVYTYLDVGPGSTVTLGSQAPGLGGTLANLLGLVMIQSTSAQPSSVILDDSGDTTGRQATFSAGGTIYEIDGLAPGRILCNVVDSSWTMNVRVLGGSGNDTFALGESFDGLALAIDGGGGTNTLDYSAYADNVLVNLRVGAASGVRDGISNFQNVVGASGGLAGSYNILVGNGGNILTGGNGRRNLLIAGSSASTLLGCSDDDILIGGTTAYDTDLASLQAIMTYWKGSDDYATRIAHLTSGNGVPLLDATTIIGNGGGNTLTGNSGLDLFYGNLAQDTYDWDPQTQAFISV